MIEPMWQIIPRDMLRMLKLQTRADIAICTPMWDYNVCSLFLWMADFRGHEATTHKKRDSLIIQHCVLYLAHILLLVSFVFQRSNLVAQFHWGHFPSFVHQSKQRHKVFFCTWCFPDSRKSSHGVQVASKICKKNVHEYFADYAKK
jgi:hypothetical protein